MARFLRLAVDWLLDELVHAVKSAGMDIAIVPTDSYVVLVNLTQERVVRPPYVLLPNTLLVIERRSLHRWLVLDWPLHLSEPEYAFNPNSREGFLQLSRLLQELPHAIRKVILCRNSPSI